MKRASRDRTTVLSPGPDDLIRTADFCYEALAPFSDADWERPAGGLDWSCRQTLEHLCGLAYSSQLATRAAAFTPLALQVRPGAPIGQLLLTMRTAARVLAEVARAAPASARAFHPAGMADASGWVAMGMDEILVHGHDIATGLAVPFVIDSDLARLVLDRLFPWWPSGDDAAEALLWANGRQDLPGRPRQGATWLWHCAPLPEWDGNIPEAGQSTIGQ